jgi:hypothetical protein
MNHTLLDRRSLDFGRRIAARLRAEPALLDVARGNLRRWQSRPETGEALRRCYAEWEALLATRDVGEIAALLEREDEEAVRLRQNSPFAGVLGPREVWHLKREFAHAP